MMDLDHLCMGCMAIKDHKTNCSQCGWVEGTEPESAMHLLPRTVINEKYLLGKVLGQGGFGITYLAWDIYLERKLAVKEFFPRELACRMAHSSDVYLYSHDMAEQYNYGLEKFLAEAKTLALFEGHPNIVTVRDFFKSNNTAYLVMPYLEGINLYEYLSQQGERLSFEEAVQIIMPVLDALKAIHKEGLLHRDVSPDNIFITTEGRVILLDFGAARHAMGEKAKNLSIILKPGYAPEEQYRSRGKQGPWTDIYAAAATLYRVITGKMIPDSLDRLSDDPLVRPSSQGVSYSPAAEGALLTALAVKAEDRFKAVADFQNALWDVLNEQGGRITTGQWGSDSENMAEEELQITHGDTNENEATAAYADVIRNDIEPDNLYHVESLNPRPVSKVGKEITVGRDPSNILVLNDSTVSRYHACIYDNSGEWYIADLSSTYGTFVNDARVENDMQLPANSYLRFSHTEIFFDGVGFFAKNGNLLFSTEVAVADVHSSKGRKIPNANQQGKKLLMVIASIFLLVVVFIVIFVNNQVRVEPTDLTAGNNQGEVGGEEENQSGSFDIIGDSSIENGTISYLGGTYTGQLKNGVPHGEGILIYEIDQTSAGLVQRGERKYEGQWLNGQMHGEGIMSYPDGTTRAGIWENNNYLGR